MEITADWAFARDPDNVGRDLGWSHRMPGNCERIAAGRPLEYWHPGYDGVAWYWKELPREAVKPGTVTQVRFGAVAYWCEAWLNGHYLGAHEGAYDEFSFALTAHLDGDGPNLLAVRVINPPTDREVEGLRSGAPLNQSNLPIGKAGWYYNYGGIWGRVWLDRLPQVHWEDFWLHADRTARTVFLSGSVRNAGELDECEWSVTIRERATGRTVAEAIRPEVLPAGASASQWTIATPDLADWSPDDPVLYDLESVLSSTHGRHTVKRTFGFREFTVSGDRFHLNGRPVLLRGLLQQGSYPRRLAGPDSWRIAARELLAMKRAGFNFLRIHLKPAEPWVLDLADRIGLLVMMEPPIGWIANTPETEGRVRREIERLVRRHRSRTCVVLWGLFNESFHLLGFDPEAIRRLADRMMALARSCDATRLLIDTSGGYARASLQGAETMIHDTFRNGASRYMVPHSAEERPMIDVHMYCPLPPAAEVVDKYRRADPRGLPLFIAEYGAAETPPNFARVLSQYTGAEREAGLEDVRLHEDFLASLTRRFVQAGLAEAFGTVEGWIAAVNAERSREMAAITLAIRSNPAVAGFCLCQLADASGELFGVLDFWRRPKPMLGALARALASPAATLTLSRRSGPERDEASGQIRIVSDDTVFGEYTLTLGNPDGSDLRLATQEFRAAAGRPFAAEWSFTPDQPGTHRIRCRGKARDGRTFEAEETFTVIPDAAAPAIRVAARLASDLDRDQLAACGLNAESFGNNFREKDTVVMLDWRVVASAANMHGEILGQIRNIAEAGGAAVLLNPDTPMLHQWLLPHFIGVQPVMRTCAYLRDSPLFAGLPAGTVAGSLYADVLGDRWDNGDQVTAAGGTIEVGAFSMHMWTRPAAYFWGAAVYRIPLGRGQVIIAHLRLLDQLATHPLARKLLANLVAYARTFIQPGGESLLFRRCIDRIVP